jgi:hypothetical protein
MTIDTQTLGAAGFGAVLGWYLYFINRYRKADVQIADLTTVIGAIGGAGVLALFDKASNAFGGYGIGLAVGFFGYFVSLVVLVWVSKTFTFDWFLDGRRPNPPAGWGFGVDAQAPIRPMMAEPLSAAPSSVQNFYFRPSATGDDKDQAVPPTAPPENR